jgi:hypothetical protein
LGVPCEARKREAGSGGRFKCMSGRQSVRTRRRVDKSDNSWGHAADRSNPSACGTLAKSRVRGTCYTARVLSAYGSLHGNMRAPRARFSPSRSARPFRGKGTRISRQALGPDEHGAMTRVRNRSPDKRSAIRGRVSETHGVSPGLRCAPSGLRRTSGCLTIEYANSRRHCEEHLRRSNPAARRQARY